MTESSATGILREAFASLSPSAHDVTRAAGGPLHEKVCAVVDALKAKGMSPEHVILTAKGIACEARMAAASEKLVNVLITWCLERYFLTEAMKSSG